jgi:ribosomal-protein-alanine N-acetyltransferase
MIHTPRLCLRSWTADDLPAFAALNADPRVMEHFPNPLARSESDALAGRIREKLDRNGYGLWAAEVVGGARFIGFVGLSEPTFQSHFTPCIEIGWRLAYESWGHGYATEAAQAVLAFAFENLRLDELVSFTTIGNQRSRRVMQRLGMTHRPADDFDHPRIAAGSPHRRHVLYRLPRATWEADRRRVAQSPRSSGAAGLEQ